MAYSKRNRRAPGGRGGHGNGNGGRGSRAGRAPAGGYGGRAAPTRDGGGNGPIYAVLGIGGVVILVLIVVLLTQDKGGTQPLVPTSGQTDPVVESGRPPAFPADTPPPPLTESEKERIRSTVERLAQREARAVRLIDEGFEAQDAGDVDVAQDCWREAREILQGMNEEAENFFATFSSPPGADNGIERVEMYAGRSYRITGKWAEHLSRFIKYVK